MRIAYATYVRYAMLLWRCGGMWLACMRYLVRHDILLYLLTYILFALDFFLTKHFTEARLSSGNEKTRLWRVVFLMAEIS